MEPKNKIPEDLGVKIGTPEEVFWTGVKNKCEGLVDQCKHEITIQEHLIKLADSKILEEKSK